MKRKRDSNLNELGREPNRPIAAMVAVTYRCPCNCDHCGSTFYEKREQDELSTDELKDLIRQFKENGATSVIFFGGEPLVRKDLLELIRLVKELGMFPVIDTNAFFIDEKMAIRLKEAGLTLALISMDSSKPEKHDKLRHVPGIWKKVVAAIKFFKKHGVEVRISTYVDREKLNDGDFQAILQMGKEMGVQVRCLAPIQAGRWNEDEDIKLTPAELQKFKNMLVPGESYWEQEVCDAPDKEFVCASGLKDTFYVTAYGHVTPCPAIPLTFGNIREEPFSDILRRMWSHEMFERRRCEDCLMNDHDFRTKYGKKFRTAKTFPVEIAWPLPKRP